MRIRHLVIAFALGCLGAAVAAPPIKVPVPPSVQEARETAGQKVPLVQLGPGDSVTISVYGQSDLNGTVYVSDDGTIPVALTGPVKVSGLSPAEASARIEKALRDGKYLVVTEGLKRGDKILLNGFNLRDSTVVIPLPVNADSLYGNTK